MRRPRRSRDPARVRTFRRAAVTTARRKANSQDESPIMTELPSGFRGRIHRGTQQIGGTCVELEAGGERILLDLGLPLDADEVSETLLPDVAGLRSPDPALRAIVISHGHGDHWGLLPLCR